MGQSSQRFSRTNRILNAAAYRQVFSGKLKSSDACFTVLACSNDNDIARLGLAIAKKHARRAVDRNRIKRLVRENFRLNKSALAGYDLVVLAKQSTVNRSNPQLSASLKAHWLQITASL